MGKLRNHMEETNLNGTRGMSALNPDSSNSEILSDNENTEEQTRLINRINSGEGSLGGTPSVRRKRQAGSNSAEGNVYFDRIDNEFETRNVVTVVEENNTCCSNPMLNFVRKVYSNYDSTFVTMLCAQYFN